MVFTKGHPFGKRFNKGQKPWNKGNLITLQCVYCGNTFEVHPCRIKTAKYCSKSCAAKNKVPWNCGLTKNDPRVAKYVKSGSITKRGVSQPHLKNYQFKKGFIPHNYMGDNVGYGALHDWVNAKLGKAINYDCIDCGKQAKQWSNIDGKYNRDTNDFKPRCVKCHRKYDKYMKEQNKNVQ